MSSENADVIKNQDNNEDEDFERNKAKAEKAIEELRLLISGKIYLNSSKITLLNINMIKINPQIYDFSYICGLILIILIFNDI